MFHQYVDIIFDVSSAELCGVRRRDGVVVDRNIIASSDLSRRSMIVMFIVIFTAADAQLVE